MPLFGELLDGWLGPVLTVIGGTVTAAFTFLTLRERLRYDAEKVKLRLDVESLQRDRDSSRVREEECAKQLNEIRTDYAPLRDKVVRFEAWAERDEREKKELLAEVAELHEKLDAKPRRKP